MPQPEQPQQRAAAATTTAAASAAAGASSSAASILPAERCLDALSPEQRAQLQNGYREDKFNKNWKASQMLKAQSRERTVKQNASPADIAGYRDLTHLSKFPTDPSQLREGVCLITVWPELGAAWLEGVDLLQGPGLVPEALAQLFEEIDRVVDEEAQGNGESKQENGDRRNGRRALLVMRVAGQTLRYVIYRNFIHPSFPS